MRAALLVLALGLAACSSAPAAPEAPPLSGTYTHDHEVGIFDGTDFAPTEVTDTMTLIERGDSLFVAVDLIGANAHLCAFRGTMGAAPSGGWVWRETLDEIYDNQTCELSLDVSPTTIRLSDRDSNCRRYYCGARAGLDGAAFERSTQTPDTTVAEY